MRGREAAAARGATDPRKREQCPPMPSGSASRTVQRNGIRWRRVHWQMRRREGPLDSSFGPGRQGLPTAVEAPQRGPAGLGGAMAAMGWGPPIGSSPQEARFGHCKKIAGKAALLRRGDRRLLARLAWTSPEAPSPARPRGLPLPPPTRQGDRRTVVAGAPAAPTRGRHHDFALGAGGG